jgi:hypothetical protein
MNTIIQLLNEAGYKNTNTNRERAVRNMNLLLDSGVMTIKFINADKYNAKEGGQSFWFKSNEKDLCTAYQVTLFGKTYNGHFIQKKSTTKYLASVAFDGTREYALDINYYDNYTLSINDIQIRVAQLISVIRNGVDFFAPKVFAAQGDCSCGKCNGKGVIPAFAYYANGICFDCGGSGIDRAVLKSFISTSIASVK